MKNLKLQFYQNYYDHFDPRAALIDDGGNIAAYNEGELKTKTRDLTDFTTDFNLEFAQFSETFFTKEEGYHRIRLITTYPGLICGTGYRHETKTAEEISIGFHFDHTTGLPVVPGSSVKGIIRSVFPQRFQPSTTEHTSIKDAKARFVLKTLGKLGVHTEEAKLSFVDELEKNLFEGIGSTGKKDVFLDAVIVAPDTSRKVIGIDTLTPHDTNQTKDPKPLPFIKVLPGVLYEFTFRLHPTTISGVEISATNKWNLLQEILLLTGVGAKTKVGYGRLVEPEVYRKSLLSKEEINDEIQAEKTDAKDEIMRSVPEEYKLTESPILGTTTKLYARVLPLSEPEQKKNSKLPDEKKRKRIEVLQIKEVDVRNKWHKSLYRLPDNAIIELSVEISSSLQDGKIGIERIIEILRVIPNE
jgi:CRISPR-associated protein Cmr6